MGYQQGQGQAPGQQGEAPGREYETEQASGRGYAPAGRHETTEHRGTVVGFTALAGTLMVLGGLWGVIEGIVALSSSHIYITAPNSNYTYHWSVHNWGWAMLILGIVVFAVGVSVFLGMAWARYLGAALAVISAIANFMLIPYTPLWSIVLIVIDAFIIWALLTPRQVQGEF
ncbi:MAG TPA: hypothetical protein VMV25_13810 [Steroidobacteraceae bacterium]|nr:hypothetical protein [Steroidobacteraceae bacterium]